MTNLGLQAVWWYRALWLDGIAEADAGRPPMPKSHTTRIVQETLAPPPPSGPDDGGVGQVYFLGGFFV